MPTALLFDDVIRHYDDCAKHVKDDARAMGWSSKFNQQLRFEVINYLLDLSHRSVLDVGCGDGGLFHYLQEKTIDCDYKGIDISPEMIRRGVERYPGIFIRKCNFFEYHQTHNTVVCSGGLSIQSGQDPLAFLSDAIDQLFSIADEHIIFNLLSTKSQKKSDLFNYYDPVQVMDLCFEKTSYVTVHHSYLPNDFTVHLIKV
ncbi:MAG: class I SAM-dependent methyltransferase [Candidatus Marinamargulisbacteria bacterium]